MKQYKIISLLLLALTIKASNNHKWYKYRGMIIPHSPEEVRLAQQAAEAIESKNKKTMIRVIGRSYRKNIYFGPISHPQSQNSSFASRIITDLEDEDAAEIIEVLYFKRPRNFHIDSLVTRKNTALTLAIGHRKFHTACVLLNSWASPFAHAESGLDAFDAFYQQPIPDLIPFLVIQARQQKNKIPGVVRSLKERNAIGRKPSVAQLIAKLEYNVPPPGFIAQKSFKKAQEETAGAKTNHEKIIANVQLHASRQDQVYRIAGPLTKAQRRYLEKMWAWQAEQKIETPIASYTQHAIQPKDSS